MDGEYFTYCTNLYGRRARAPDFERSFPTREGAEEFTQVSSCAAAHLGLVIRIGKRRLGPTT